MNNKIKKIGNIYGYTGGSFSGNVYDTSGISPTLTNMGSGGNRQPLIIEKNRIRKLTPKECFRLMGVSDEDADKMMAVNSNTQCYKQAGNSIVVDVLAAIFKELFA